MPYESPLRYFHAYRFHPEYQGAVAGGLKSLTYSNRIDPEKEMCPFELSGEQCPDNCQFQHFGSIGPPGESCHTLGGLLTKTYKTTPPLNADSWPSFIQMTKSSWSLAIPTSTWVSRRAASSRACGSSSKNSRPTR